MLPNLMEWVMPDSRPQIFCWLQDHVNAFISGQTCTLAIFCEVFFFRFEEKSRPQLFVHRWGLGGVPNVFFVGGEAFFLFSQWMK